MAFEATKRLTRFPGDDELNFAAEKSLLGIPKSDQPESESKRYTLFPGTTDLEPPTSVNLSNVSKSTSKKLESSQIPPRLPLAVNRPDAPSSRSLSTELNLQQNPYSKYKILRGIDRYDKVKVAYTVALPTHIVTLKQVTCPLPLNEILECHHRNLLKLLEVYKFEGKTIVVSEYAQVSLKQMIAIPIDLEEVHISNICYQVQSTFTSDLNPELTR
jgi:hypothetical protein